MPDLKPTFAPSTGKYVGVWVLASVAAYVTTSLADSFSVRALMDPDNPVEGPFWLFAPVLRFGVWCLTIGTVYLAFPSLRMRKVIPWFAGLGLLGVVFSVWQTNKAFEEVGHETPLEFPISMVVSFAAAIAILNWYFKTRQSHRY